jgi:hypothetical protein
LNRALSLGSIDCTSGSGGVSADRLQVRSRDLGEDESLHRLANSASIADSEGMEAGVTEHVGNAAEIANLIRSPRRFEPLR